MSQLTRQRNHIRVLSADLARDILEERAEQVLELFLHVMARREPIREAPQRLIERLAEKAELEEMVSEERDTCRHAFAIVHHDARFALRLEHPSDLPDDAAGARGVV